MSMENSDLLIRHENLQEKYAALQEEFDELQAQAFALVWHIPNHVTIQSIRDTKDRMLSLVQRSKAQTIIEAQLHEAQRRIVELEAELKKPARSGGGKDASPMERPLDPDWDPYRT